MAARALTGILEGDPQLIEAIAPPPPPPPGSVPPPRQPPSPRLIVLLCVLAVVGIVGGVSVAREVTKPPLAVTGPPPNAEIGSSAVDGLAFSQPGTRHQLRHERWTLDGRNVTRLVVEEAGRLIFVHSGLAKAATRSRSVPAAASSARRRDGASASSSI